MSFEERTSESLRRIVGGLCEEIAVADELPSALRRSVAAVGLKLDDPLRVAIGGKVSAGKSTLVNALLGRRVAEVRAEETRRVTTIFRWAGEDRERVLAHLATGQTRELQFTSGGALPQIDGVDGRAVRSLEVRLKCDAVKRFDIVDTPGLFSADRVYSDLGRRSLLGDSERLADMETGSVVRDEDFETQCAMRDADALVYLIGDAVSEADLDVLSRFRVEFGRWKKSGFNSVALIGKADAVGSIGVDAFSAAAEQAAEARRCLGPAVAAVVPVSALLAETARIRALGEKDLDLLRRLAAAPPPDGILANMPLFEERYGSVGAHLSLALGSYGIRFAIDHLRTGDATDLAAALEVRSGLADVGKLLMRHFHGHADVIKAEAALAEIKSAAERARSNDRAAADGVLKEVARLHTRPEFHRVNEAVLHRRVMEQEITFGADADVELEYLLALSDPRERLRLTAEAGDEDVRAGVRVARSAWAARRDDRLRPLAARRAAPVVLETLRRLAADFEVEMTVRS